MKLPEFHDLDLSIARARIALSLIAMLSLYIDPSTAGGLFHLNAYALTTLLCHLAYSVGIYFALSRRLADGNLQVLSTAFDLFFATAIAFITEGQTSASYVFFVFAIVATGSRARTRPIITDALQRRSVLARDSSDERIDQRLRYARRLPGHRGIFDWLLFAAACPV